MYITPKTVITTLCARSEMNKGELKDEAVRSRKRCAPHVIRQNVSLWQVSLKVRKSKFPAECWVLRGAGDQFAILIVRTYKPPDSRQAMDEKGIDVCC